MDLKFTSMVYIKSGSFEMGSPEGQGGIDEHPQHTVTLDAFYMDISEVTQRDYEALMGINPSIYLGDGMLPVENVTWYDAVLYCNSRSKRDGLPVVYRFTGEKGKAGDGCEALENLVIDYSIQGYRLPTEAEWEYACRASTMTKHFWGEEMDGNYAWWEMNSGGRTQPVYAKQPNAWGLYDMCGNVQEWCNDWHGEKYFAESPAYSPKGPDLGIHRILRGGSWYPYQDGGAHLRSANRSCHFPYYRRDAYGFRCVISH